MINVRSPCWSSSSGVGGNGRFGGPAPPCVDDALLESSVNTLRPGLYENSGLTKSKTNQTQNSHESVCHNKSMCKWYRMQFSNNFKSITTIKDKCGCVHKLNQMSAHGEEWTDHYQIESIWFILEWYVDLVGVLTVVLVDRLPAVYHHFVSDHLALQLRLEYKLRHRLADQFKVHTTTCTLTICIRAFDGCHSVDVRLMHIVSA